MNEIDNRIYIILLIICVAFFYVTSSTNLHNLQEELVIVEKENIKLIQQINYLNNDNMKLTKEINNSNYEINQLEYEIKELNRALMNQNIEIRSYEIKESKGLLSTPSSPKNYDYEVVGNTTNEELNDKIIYSYQSLYFNYSLYKLDDIIKEYHIIRSENTNEYEDNIYDCVDFSFNMRDELRERFPKAAVGLIIVHNRDVWHMANIIMDENKELWYFEPQYNQFFPYREMSQKTKYHRIHMVLL